MWRLAPAPNNEAERLNVLRACGLMDIEPDERFDRLTRLATRIYEADAAFIGLVDDQFQSLISLSSDQLACSIPRGDSVCNSIVSSGKPMVVGNLKTDPRFNGHPLVPQLTLCFYAGAPIFSSPDLVLGTLCVMRREPGDEDTFDLGPLLDLSAIAASEIVQWRANQELRRQSQTDSLTGLANRRAFDEALTLAVRRAARTGQPISLILLDLDHFKQLNDHGGHQMGDDVLRALGDLLLQRPRRPHDTPARIGGEEFALILPDTDAAGARAVAANLLEDVRRAQLRHPTRGIVTASIGMTSLMGEAASASDLFKKADMALYAAKTGGRDTFRD